MSLSLKQISELPRSQVIIIDNVAKFGKQPKRDTDHIYIPMYTKKDYIHRSTGVRFGLCVGVDKK
jgi:hypothetical protein